MNSEARAAGPGMQDPVQVLDRTGICRECAGTWHLTGGRVWCEAADIFLNKCPRTKCSGQVPLGSFQFPPEMVIDDVRTVDQDEDSQGKSAIDTAFRFLTGPEPAPASIYTVPVQDPPVTPREKFQKLEGLFEEDLQQPLQDPDPALVRFNTAVYAWLKSQRLLQPGKHPVTEKKGG